MHNKTVVPPGLSLEWTPLCKGHTFFAAMHVVLPLIKEHLSNKVRIFGRCPYLRGGITVLLSNCKKYHKYTFSQRLICFLLKMLVILVFDMFEVYMI